MCKYSVVVKGIERKLKELGCKVSIITQEHDTIPKIDEERETQLFILYLPTKIMDDRLKFNWLEHIYNVIYEMKGEILVIGDKWDREDLAGRIFDMLHVGWLDRPLKMEELELAVTEGIHIWNISDTLNGLMALPNLIGLLLLSLTLRRIVRDYDGQKAEDIPAEKPCIKEWKGKLVLAACAVLLPLVIAAWKGSGQETVHRQDVSLQTVMESGQFVFGVDENFPPMSYMNANGELIGFDIDLAREICSRMGVACKMRPIAWNDKEAELDDRKIDCIASMSVPLQPLENMCLSEAYVGDNLVFVVRGDSHMMWMCDLKGKVLGVQAGSTTFDALQASELYKLRIGAGKVPCQFSCIPFLFYGRIIIM